MSKNHYGYENIVNYEILCSFLLLGTVPCWAGIAYSQNVKMSLDMENTTVHDVINAIEKKEISILPII